MAKQTHPCDYEWDFTWTTDQKSWQVRQFETLEGLRSFAKARFSENEGNLDFMGFARRYCVVGTGDLLDDEVPASRVRISGHYRTYFTDELSKQVDEARKHIDALRAEIMAEVG